MFEYELPDVVDALDYLARFCIISPQSRRHYNHVFNAVAGSCAAQTLNLNQVCAINACVTNKQLTRGLQIINENLITSKEKDYILMYDTTYTVTYPRTAIIISFHWHGMYFQ